MNICPAIFGSRNWAHASYNPKTNLVFLPGMELCNKYSIAKEIEYKRGALYIGADFTAYAPDENAGVVRAIDPTNQKTVWEWWTKAPLQAGGTVATAGGLVFVGTQDGRWSRSTRPTASRRGSSASARRSPGRRSASRWAASSTSPSSPAAARSRRSARRRRSQAAVPQVAPRRRDAHGVRPLRVIGMKTGQRPRPRRPHVGGGGRGPRSTKDSRPSRARGYLRVCADPANLPYSSNDTATPGFEVELARAGRSRARRDAAPGVAQTRSCVR
jgi:hypothetical protein